mgnify:CR=1 FL=1
MATFEINCTTCSFSTVVEGGVESVHDRIEEHRTDVEGDPKDHFVVVWISA